MVDEMIPVNASREREERSGLDDRLAMMELVLEITRRFASSLDLNELLSQVLSLTVNTVGADRGSIFLFDNEGRVIRQILARRNLPAEESEQVVTAVLDKGLAGWAMRHQQVALVEDTLNDERWHHLPGDEMQTRSAIAVPLLQRGQLNGLLTLTKGEPYAFTQVHVALAAAIGSQAAIAVENARLFTRMRSERATLLALIRGVGQPIIVTDTQNRVRYTNPAAQMLDPRLANGTGQPVESIIPSEKLAELFQELLVSGQPQRDEITWKDGRTFDANLVLVPGVGAVAVLHDVTHFKQLDRMKSDFVATVSHDLKAPLTVIYGYVELLKESLPVVNELAAKGLDEIVNSATRMQNLITTLLDLAQIESGLDRAAQPCQMADIVADVVKGYQLQAVEKRIDLTVGVGQDLPVIRGHPLRLSQALANLVGNALKYTPEGGQVHVGVQVSDHRLIVQVSDTGPGIPEDKQAGLFGKFYKVGTSETLAQEGHGLGLAIVKSVIDAHDGRVWVRSAAGQGSIFAFALPIPVDTA